MAFNPLSAKDHRGVALEAKVETLFGRLLPVRILHA
jgi:hypothetical protein